MEKVSSKIADGWYASFANADHFVSYFLQRFEAVKLQNGRVFRQICLAQLFGLC